MGERQDKVDELANELWHVFIYNTFEPITPDGMRVKLKKIATFVLRNYTKKEK